MFIIAWNVVDSILVCIFNKIIFWLFVSLLYLLYCIFQVRFISGCKLIDFLVFYKGSLSADSFKKFKLVERKQLSHNVAKFKFALPSPTSVLGLPIGQHLSCKLVVWLWSFCTKYCLCIFIMLEIVGFTSKLLCYWY